MGGIHACITSVRGKQTKYEQPRRGSSERKASNIALHPRPTSLIAANKRDYLADKQLHARQLPKHTRRNNFGTGVVYIYRGRRPVFKTIDTAHRKVNLDDDAESWSWNSTHAMSWRERYRYLSVCLSRV